MYIIAPQIEKSSTPEYQAGEKVQKTANSFSSIFSEIVESKHSEKSTETIQTEKARKNKQVNEKQQVDDKQIAEKIKSLDISKLDISKLSGLTKQEKQALYAKIEKLLEALKTGKDTKELFAAWTQGKLDLVIPLEVNQGQNVKNTVLLQLVFAGKGESTKSFNLNLLQMDSDGMNENASKVLKQFTKTEHSEKAELIAVMKNESAKVKAETNSGNQKVSPTNPQPVQQVTTDNNKIVLTVVGQKDLHHTQQMFGKHLSALLSSLDGKAQLKSMNTKSSGKESHVEGLTEFKNQVQQDAKQKKVQMKSQDVQIHLNEKSQKPQVGINLNESNGAGKNFVHALQNMIGETSTIRGFGQTGSVNTQSVLAQVVQKIESMVQTARIQQNSLQSNTLNANLALKPQSLGSVMMNLRFHQDTLSGLITTATKEAKALIEANLPAIKEALQQQNTVVQNIEVEVRPDLEQEHQSAFAEEFSDRKDNENEDSNADNLFGAHMHNQEPAVEIINPVKSTVNLTGAHAYYA